jgi:hypothetical protein
MESILISEIEPTDTSKILGNNIIMSLQGQALSYASRDFLNANARWLMIFPMHWVLGVLDGITGL